MHVKCTNAVPFICMEIVLRANHVHQDSRAVVTQRDKGGFLAVAWVAQILGFGTQDKRPGSRLSAYTSPYSNPELEQRDVKSVAANMMRESDARRR